METQFEHFFQANERRIHFQIHRLRIPHNLYDEFYTEGIVALWQAYQDVDQAKGNVGTFLNYRIRYRLIDLIRKKQREAELDEEFFQHHVTEMTDGTRHRDSNTPLLNIPNLPSPTTHFGSTSKSSLPPTNGNGSATSSSLT